MSVNIHGGRIIRAPLGRAYEMLMQAKPDAKAIGERLQEKWMVERAVDIIDTACLKGDEVEQPLMDAWKELLDRMKKIKATMQRDPQVDFEFDLWLFPLGRRTLLLVQSEQREMQDYVDGLPFVEPYAYWDSTDPDEDVERSEWRRRMRDWEKVLPRLGIPSDTCLTMVMFNSELAMPPSGSRIRPHIPSLEDRIARHASTRHVSETMNRLIEEKKIEDPEYKMTDFSLVFKAERIAREAHDRRNEIKAEIRTRLRRLKIEDIDIRKRHGRG